MKRGGGLDVRALRIFEAVASSGSLSAGAKQLGVTQSAISQALVQIETVLETPVFDRSHRPFKLTPAGIALSRRARLIVEDIDRLVIHVRDADLASRPAMRVGLIDSFAATAGPAIIKKITASASQLLVWSGLAYSHTHALLNRQLDLIVTPDTLEDVDHLIRRPLFTEPFVVVVPRTRQKELQHADLNVIASRLPFIRFSARSHFGATIERHIRRLGLSPRPYLEIDTSDVVLSMVAAELGWAITTPLCLLQGRANLAQVAVFPLVSAPLSRTLYQLSRQNEYEDMAETCFQVSRSVLETEIFPEIRTHMPWLRNSIALN
ncbi:MAG: LysR family transcriptional regulator [Alcaligenaceae bacterium]|nr:MAG: LysR family transcriptional regulator [Alcaligenaceae bacterium]